MLFLTKLFHKAGVSLKEGLARSDASEADITRYRTSCLPTAEYVEECLCRGKAAGSNT